MLTRPVQRGMATLVVVSCVALFMAACSGEPSATVEPSPTPDDRPQSTISEDLARIYLVAPQGTYQEGWAELRNTAAGVTVTLDVAPSYAETQPAHIHLGNCDQLEDIVHNLVDVFLGESTTEIPGVTIADVATGGMAINIHRSFGDFPTYTACGEIPALP